MIFILNAFIIIYFLITFEIKSTEFAQGLFPYDPKRLEFSLEYTNWPPFITISGLEPKNSGLHKTKSAILLGSKLPIACEQPANMAGFIVYFAT